MATPPGRKLLAHDRRLGVRFVAGADEAGRGSLAGPLVVAGVLFDYDVLYGHRVRPLGGLNDSKQLSHEEREALFHAVLGCASRISVRFVSHGEIDRSGLHRSNLAGLRAVLAELHPPAEACLVDGFRLGPSAPPHRAIVDGDCKSAAIAAASIVAKVVRDRVMRRLDALFPRYGFRSHVGYITPGHSAAVRTFGPSHVHRLSFQARCYEGELDETYTGGAGETDAVPVGCTGRRDAASSVAPIRETVLGSGLSLTPTQLPTLPASLPPGDRRKPPDEARSARPSAA